MDEKIKLLIAELGEERVKLNEPLKNHTFSKLGGPAKIFYIATTQRELIKILDLSYALKIDYLVLGNGTKFLPSAKGFEGLVIKNRTTIVKIGGIKGKVSAEGLGIEEALIEADSGVSLGRLNEFLKEQKLTEILGMSSLKSSVGGSIFLDEHLREQTQQVKVWDREDVFEISVNELNRNKHVVLSIVVKVKSQN
jgi:UDP-N-acetylmuramate dehydrogenase